MGRSHHFHLDHHGHSITVNVRPGRTSRLELLVDGKEVFRQRVQGTGTSVLTGELPGDPPVPFRVLVHQPRLGALIPRCSLEVDGVEQPMPERAMV
ncbi:hypothetical protein ACFYYR_07305 [Streptomyces sp. NPDC001922]|uniref:hypothetical protein n=1 Tax=Streptomyces sp. NPDC001922 TaxID=3364624 RepID=UPI003689F72F